MPKAIGIKIYAQDNYKNHEEAHLVFEITNLTASTLHILKWNTPLEGLNSPCLDVKSGNKKIDYDGIMIKRGSPQANDFYQLDRIVDEVLTESGFNRQGTPEPAVAIIKNLMRRTDPDHPW